MNRMLSGLILLCGLWPGAGALASDNLVPATGAGTWKTVDQIADASLQSALEARIRANPEWRGLVERKRLAVALIDLGGDQPRFADVNGDQMMYSASLPKIAILLAAYAAIDEGTLSDSEDVRRDMAAMIRRSDNGAATRMIDRVGMAKIESVLTDPRYELYDERRGGGLWVGKRYAKKGARKGDPLYGISHGATARQVARFYYLLASGRLINPLRSEQMLADLVDPQINHKFVSAIRQREPRARLYRKSGTWRNYHSDSVLVRGPVWRNYILVAITESENGGRIIGDLVEAAESVLNANTSRLAAR